MTLKTWLAAGIASTLIAVSSPTHAQDLDFNWRIAYAPRYYSLDLNESKKIPVHPDEVSFLHGDTEVKAGSGWDFLVLDLGAEARFGKKEGFNIFGGADLEIDGGSGKVFYDSNGRHDIGMFTLKQQSSDTRPERSGSFVYDKLEPKLFSIIPFVGVGFKGKKYSFDLEYALSNREFERKWGHYRFGEEEAIGSEKYDSKGSRFAFGTKVLEDDVYGIAFMWSLQLMYENCDLEKDNRTNAGKLKSYSIGLALRKSF